MDYIDGNQLLGLLGMILVFVSFIVKDWKWLYTFNMSGATILAIYAYLNNDPIFTIVEAGIVLFLAIRLARELREKNNRSL
ncbi:MAG: hypothetical protein GSR77_00920 [Desulfurococcales archaeon]|nr:hypothetical protein [Desulfurococcales archaeon]